MSGGACIVATRHFYASISSHICVCIFCKRPNHIWVSRCSEVDCDFRNYWLLLVGLYKTIFLPPGACNRRRRGSLRGLEEDRRGCCINWLHIPSTLSISHTLSPLSIHPSFCPQFAPISLFGNHPLSESMPICVQFSLYVAKFPFRYLCVSILFVYFESFLMIKVVSMMGSWLILNQWEARTC